jgi:hypothetical protein
LSPLTRAGLRKISFVHCWSGKVSIFLQTCILIPRLLLSTCMADNQST